LARFDPGCRVAGIRRRCFGAEVDLNVYTALETDQLKAYTEGFNKAYPNIDIKWTRDSTGVITSKLLAEKANPVADLVVGVSASSLAVFANEGMLQGYAPKGLDKISRAVPRSGESAVVGRHGRLRRRHLLQHRRSAEAQPAQARDLART
jgi:ABC-type Fe3+ transport system substrate-binding protein